MSMSPADAPPAARVPPPPPVRSHNYKLLKENFVANLNGGSIWEINLVTLTLPVTPFPRASTRPFDR
jgi:hypothetical protein